MHNDNHDKLYIDMKPTVVIRINNRRQNMDNQKTIRYSLEVIAALLIAMVLSANAAPSENEVTYINQAVPLDYTLYNVCDPGNVPINLVGESTSQVKIFNDENGLRSIKGLYKLSVTGKDANGIRYIVNGNFNINNKLPEDGPYTEVSIFKVISQGSTDNFFIKSLIHISQDGTTKSEFESYCRG